MEKSFSLSVPVSAIWNNRTATLESIKIDLNKFNKTHALFLCAKLNLITNSGRTYDINRDIAQSEAFQLLLSDQLVSQRFVKKVNAFRQLEFKKNRRLAIVFSREGLLEMMRSLCLWGNNEISHNSFLKHEHTQDAFFCALLTSTEFFMGRYARFFPDAEPSAKVLEGEDLEQFRRNYQPMMRIMSEYAPPVRDPLFSLGRAHLLLIEEFFNKHDIYANEFRTRHEDLSIDEYIACATSILSVSLSKMKQDQQVKSLRDSFLFEEEKMFSKAESMREPFKKYLKCKAQSVEELSEKFAGAFRGLDKLLNLKPIRERPILLDKGIGVVLDEKLFADSVSVGPMFALLKNDKYWNRQVFSDFGNACHRYAHRIIAHYYEVINNSSKAQVICEPVGVHTINSKQERSLGDSLVIENQNAAIFETKGNWFNESALENADLFWEEINRLYGISTENGEEKRRGFAQLADVIQAMALEQLKAVREAAKFNDITTIFPVLLAHDELVHQINLAHHLSKLFAKEFGLDNLPECGHFEFQNRKIYSLIVLSFSDLEMLQARQIDEGMTFYFQQYSDWSPRRNNTLNEFFATKFPHIARRPKIEQLLLKAASEKISDVAVMCFGQALPD